MMQMHSNTATSSAMQIQPTYPGVQPHINPRFAAAFGINMNFMQQHQYSNTTGSNGDSSEAVSSAYTPNGWNISTGTSDHNSGSWNEHKGPDATNP
jgi:hypothetical protein